MLYGESDSVLAAPGQLVREPPALDREQRMPLWLLEIKVA